MRRRWGLAVVLMAPACSLAFDPRSYAREGDDASTGAVAPDASTGSDAHADATPDGGSSEGGAATRFCETRPTPYAFCVDFDEQPSQALEALGAPRTSEGTLTFTNEASSSPRALFASASGTSARAAFYKELPAGPLGSITFSFDQKLNSVGASYAQLGELMLSKDDRECVVRLVSDDGKFAFIQACYEDGSELDRQTVNLSHAVDTAWHHVSLGVHAAAEHRLLKLTFDDTELSYELTPYLTATNGVTATAVLGLEFLPEGTMTSTTDNGVVTVP